MRIGVAIASGTLLVACAVSRQFYLPTDPTLAREGTTCGSDPYGNISLPLEGDIRVSLSVSPKEQTIASAMQVSLPPGTSLRFPDPRVKFSTADGNEFRAALSPWHTSVYGRGGAPGHAEYIKPDELLEGRGQNADLAGPREPHLARDLFISPIERVPMRAPSELVLTFPAAEINGHPVKAKEIALRLVERSGVQTCVQ